MSGWTLGLLLGVAVLSGFIAIGMRRLMLLWRSKRTGRFWTDSYEGDDSRTKRNLATALNELRMLREALPADSELRVERRKVSGLPPNGEERRKSRKR